MQRSLVVKHRANHFQTIESSSFLVIARLFICIIALLDYLQLLNYQVAAKIFTYIIVLLNLQVIKSSRLQVVIKEF